MSDADKAFHDSSKPHFSETGVFIYGNKGAKNLESGALLTAQEPLAGALKDIRFAKLRAFDDVSAQTWHKHTCTDYGRLSRKL